MRLSLFRRILPIAGAGAMLVAMTTVLPATATPARVRAASALQLTVSPKESAWDAPLTISITGVKPGQRVTLGVTSVDCHRRQVEFVFDVRGQPFRHGQPGDLPGGPRARWQLLRPRPHGPGRVHDDLSREQHVLVVGAQEHDERVPLKGSWSKALSFVFSATSGQAHASVTVRAWTRATGHGDLRNCRC